MISEFLAPKTQPVWHHFALTQRSGLIASGTRSQVWPAARSVAAHSPPDFDTWFQVGLVDAQPALGARVVAGRALRARSGCGHMRRSGPSPGRRSRRSKVSVGERSDAAR